MLHLSVKGGYFNISKKLIDSWGILNIYVSKKILIYIIYINNQIKLLKFLLTKLPQIG